MTSKIIFKYAALWTCTALGARSLTGCVVDSSSYHETPQDGDPSEAIPAQSALSRAPQRTSPLRCPGLTSLTSATSASSGRGVRPVLQEPKARIVRLLRMG